MGEHGKDIDIDIDMMNPKANPHITVVMFLWRPTHKASLQDHDKRRFKPGYSTEYIKKMCNMLRKNFTLSHDIAVVTNDPEYREELKDLDIKIVSVPIGAPNNLRQKLWIFHPKAEQIFGNNTLFACDIDTVITSNIDHLFRARYDLILWYNDRWNRNIRSEWYNTSFIYLHTNTVYTNKIWNFYIQNPNRRVNAGDQGFVNLALGPNYKYLWTSKNHGIYDSYVLTKRLPENACIVTFPGHSRPGDTETQRYRPWIPDNWK